MPVKPTVTLLHHTPQPEHVVAAAARICYSATGATGLLEGMDDEKAADFVEMLAELGHESPMEHVSFTFAIEGVSRSFLAQITRHRIASYSVQSQRYVNLDDFQWVEPPAVEQDPEAADLYREAMEGAAERYRALADRLTETHTKRLIGEGIPEKKAKQQARKLANEDSRFLLPNACETKLVVTMNTRSLMNFFRHRCCNRAQWEIRAVAEAMLRLVREAAPTLFKKAGPPCVAGPCPEGKMSCGKATEMRQRYTPGE